MFKVYFKQAFRMLKQNRFISIISIIGTALAIMMIMTIIVSDEVRHVSLPPEIHRDRTLYLDNFMETDTTGGKNSMRGSSGVRYAMLKDYIYKMKTPEQISAVVPYWEGRTQAVRRVSSNEILNRAVRASDASYWKQFEFSFVSGRAFSQEEFASGIPVAVLSESMAKELFRGESAEGATIEIAFMPYRVVGVVKDVSPVFRDAFGEVWIPYTSQEAYEKNTYNVFFLLRDKADAPAATAEVLEIERQFALSNAPYTLDLGGPITHRVSMMKNKPHFREQIKSAVKMERRRAILIFAILLLVPALNLSGFSLSRMRKRTEEIGVRKAFGAKRHVILIQILYENMLTSLIGGIIGLVFSYFLVYSLRHWLLIIPKESAIPFSSFVSFSVFLMVFVVCVLLNLLSAGIPAYRVSKASIVNSLNKNDR